MHIEYTPEEVRTLIEEHEALDFTTATTEDLAEATDVLEGVEELIAKLDPALRYETVDPCSIPVGAEGGQAWIPVANNCTRSAGVAVTTDGTLSFTVRSDGGELTSYFAARQAVAHALAGAQSEADCSIIEQSSRVETTQDTELEDPLVTLLKQNGWAIAAGRTLADLDDEVLAQAYRLSEEGIAHLFATEAGDGIVLAMAGSTEGDRRRAVEALPTLPGRGYSSRSCSVLFDLGEAGDHYSEKEGFGQTVKEAPKPKEHLLVAAAERFKAARFVRPSSEKPLDTGAIRFRVRRVTLVKAAARYAMVVDPADAGELIRRVAAVYLIARYFSRKMVRRALDAETPWDSKAERNRMVKRGMKLREEIARDRRNRYGKPIGLRQDTGPRPRCRPREDRVGSQDREFRDTRKPRARGYPRSSLDGHPGTPTLHRGAQQERPGGLRHRPRRLPPAVSGARTQAPAPPPARRRPARG